MFRILFTLFCFSSMLSFADTISHNGVSYEVESKSAKLNCSDFTITIESRSLSFDLRESKIPYEITIGHFGRPHLISQSVKYFSPEGEKVTYDSVTPLLPKYSRVEKGRKYISKPGACVGKDSATFVFWGGGNCNNVCEAWALVTFSNSGKIVSTKGISYKDFKGYD